MRCHDFIVYSFQGSRDTGKIARKRSSRALTSRILRSRECCMAENVQRQQRKKAWSTAPPLPSASLQISFSPALLRSHCTPCRRFYFFLQMETECPRTGAEEGIRLRMETKKDEQAQISSTASARHPPPQSRQHTSARCKQADAHHSCRRAPCCCLAVSEPGP